MQYTVPRFKHETKIVGPLTFKEFIFIIISVAACVFLYFTLGKKISFLFLLLSSTIVGSALSLAFLKVGGRPVSVVLIHFLTFSISSKVYIWKKKEIGPPKFIPKKELKKMRPSKKTASVPKIASKSRLKKLASQIEIKTR